MEYKIVNLGWEGDEMKVFKFPPTLALRTILKLSEINEINKMRGWRDLLEVCRDVLANYKDEEYTYIIEHRFYYYMSMIKELKITIC